MNKKLSFLSVFEIKPLELFCYFFTISVIVAAMASTAIDIQESFARAIWGLVITCAAPVFSLMALNTKTVSLRIENMRNDIVIGLAFHFLTTIGIVAIAAFVLHILLPLEDKISLGVAIWNDLVPVMQSYALALLVAKIIDSRRTAEINKALKIIQRSQNFIREKEANK